MTNYCYIVSACKKYVPELCALLNSLDYVGNRQDVFLIGYQLPKEFTDQFSKLSYAVNYYNVPEAEAREYGGESEILCRKRYWYAADVGKDYKAICVLDADMVVIRPLTQFFEIAEKTNFIVGASLEQKRMYGNIEHHKARGKHLIPEPVWNEKDICCAPIFINMNKYGQLFQKSWEIFIDGFPDDNFKAPDMESYNLLILKEKLSDKVLMLPNFQFVNSNEKGLKPYLRFVLKGEDPTPGGKIWSEIGDPIYILHGCYYNLIWRNQQILNRLGCIKGYIGGSEKCENMARGAFELAYSYFKHCLNGKIKIDTTIAYRNKAEPGEAVVTV